MAALILGAHFDDVVYSCGALIARKAAAGEAITLMTVCGGEIPVDPPDSPIVNELHARWRAANGSELPQRQAEEREAARALAAEVAPTVIALPFADCIYRRDREGRALYTQGAHLGGQPQPGDPLPAQLRALPWPAEWKADELYLPLAMGGHVDHRIVREWALAGLAGHPDVRAYAAAFAYADFPYTRFEGALAEALANLPAPWQVQPAAIPPPTPAELAAKIRAMTAYRSQNDSFWENDAMMAHEVAATPERYWRFCH